MDKNLLSNRVSTTEIFFVLLVVGMRVASAPTADASYLVLTIYALCGQTQAIRALGLSWLFSMLNPGIAAEATFASVGRYAVIGAAAASVFLRSGRLGAPVRASSMVVATLLLGVFFVFHSLVFSPFADVSVLKSASWSLVAATLMAAWGQIDDESRHRLSSQLFGGLVLVLLFSLPLLAVPSLGYLRNGTGFQGILSHPQGFGPTMALLGAWAGARMLGDRQPPWLIVALVGACLVLVVLSEARTAGVAMMVGLCVAVLIVPLLSGTHPQVMLPGLMSRRVHMVVGMAIVAAFLASSQLTDRLGEYFAKRGQETTGLGDALEKSRGRLIDAMFENIEADPLTGIGFGIASWPEGMVVDRDPFLGLPTGAVIEKGVMPVAVVEELGIFGAVAVFCWLWVVVVRASRSSVSGLAVVLTVILLNFGESTFFSPGGFGLLPLILIAWAATSRPKSRAG